MEELMRQLEEVVYTPGVSGREKPIAALLAKKYAPYCDEIIYDNLGSIYAVIRSERPAAPKVLVSAHMDEAGFFVKKIEANGLIRGLIMGKIEANSLQGQEVRLITRSGEKYFGVVLGIDKNNHGKSQKDEVLLDFGFSTKDVVLAEEITLGDMVTFAPKMKETSNGQAWIASNWNGRINVSQTIDLVKAMAAASVKLPYDLMIGCTVQEQVGTRGAQTAANVTVPDFTIVLDTAQAMDYQHEQEDQQGFLGKGLLLTYYNPTVLPNRLPLERLKAVCQTANLPCQSYFSYEASDGAWFNKLRTGCPILLASLSVRNKNTASQVVARRDYETALQALARFLTELDEEAIRSFKEENR